MSNRRQQIKDWLLSTDNPEAEYLLNSLNQMNLDDWEQKHRSQLRRLKGYADLEKSTVSLRDRARGEFDTYVDNPEWYIKGKAAKLGVNIDDLKKTLGELQKEKEYFEGRERRKKEVKDDFKWNFASDWAKQRYIDTPEKSYWANPENIKMRNEKATIIPISALKKEGIEEVCRFIENKVSEWRK